MRIHQSDDGNVGDGVKPYGKGVKYDKRMSMNKRMHDDHPFHAQDAARDADLIQYSNLNNLFNNYWIFHVVK